MSYNVVFYIQLFTAYRPAVLQCYTVSTAAPHQDQTETELQWIFVFSTTGAGMAPLLIPATGTSYQGGTKVVQRLEMNMSRRYNVIPSR